MKKDLQKLVLLLAFSAVALGGCAIESRGHRRYDNRYYNGRYDRDHRYDNRYHRYNNY